MLNNGPAMRAGGLWILEEVEFSFASVEYE